MSRKKRSMTRIYWIALGILLVVCTLDIVVRNRTQMEINRTMEAFYDSSVSEKIDGLQQRLKGIGKSITNIIYDNDSIERIERHSEGIERISAINDLQDVFYKYQTIAGNQVHMFMIDSVNDAFIVGSSGVLDYVTLLDIEEAVRRAVDSDSLALNYGNNRWDCILIQGNPYFIKLYYSQSRRSYVGCWANAWDMLDFVSSTDIYGSQKTFIINADGMPLDADGYGEALGGLYDPSALDQNHLQVLRNHLIYHVFPNLCNFSMVITLDTVGIYGNYMASRQLFWLMSAGILVMGLLLILYTKRRVINPIIRMSAELENYSQINAGDEYAFDELNQMSQAIGGLYDQVESLKLAAYEQELQKEKIRLSYLQQQIRPHFYINCLDIIYNMAQIKKYDQIQRLSKAVAAYLRSTFREGTRAVTLRQELELVEGYIDIYTIRYEGDFEFEKSVNIRDMDCLVPPMLIQTLVENALKHNVMRVNNLFIKLTVGMDPADAELLCIQVEDNGTGMDKELMSKLNCGIPIRNENGQSIGLSNMIDRIRFIYHENCSICFSARDGGGTCIIVKLPVDGGNANESATGR